MGRLGEASMNRARSRPLTKGGQRPPTLSISEARAEVATLILWALLDELPANVVQKVKRAAAEDALATGIVAILRESDWLLASLDD
jgi:hypothetical protein